MSQTDRHAMPPTPGDAAVRDLDLAHPLFPLSLRLLERLLSALHRLSPVTLSLQQLTFLRTHGGQAPAVFIQENNIRPGWK